MCPQKTYSAAFLIVSDLFLCLKGQDSEILVSVS